MFRGPSFTLRPKWRNNTNLEESIIPFGVGTLLSANFHEQVLITSECSLRQRRNSGEGMSKNMPVLFADLQLRRNVSRELR